MCWHLNHFHISSHLLLKKRINIFLMNQNVIELLKGKTHPGMTNHSQVYTCNFIVTCFATGVHDDEVKMSL